MIKKIVKLYLIYIIFVFSTIDLPFLTIYQDKIFIPMFPDYQHIYTARLLEIDPLSTFNQVYFPIVGILIFLIHVFTKIDYIYSISIFYIFYKYILAFVFAYFSIHLIESYNNSKPIYKFLKIVSFLILSIVLIDFQNDYVLFYLVSHTLSIFLYLVIIARLFIIINKFDNKIKIINNLINQFTLIFLLAIFFGLIYLVIYIKSSINSIIMIPIFVIFYILITRLLKIQEKLLIIIVIFLYFVHPVEATMAIIVISISLLLFKFYLKYLNRILYIFFLYLLFLLLIIYGNLFPFLSFNLYNNFVLSYNPYTLLLLKNQNLIILLLCLLFLYYILLSRVKIYLLPTFYYISLHYIVAFTIPLFIPTEITYRLVHYMFGLKFFIIYIILVSYITSFYTFIKNHKIFIKFFRLVFLVLTIYLILTNSLSNNLLSNSLYVSKKFENIMGYTGELTKAEIESYVFLKNYLENYQLQFIKKTTQTPYRNYIDYYINNIVLISDPYTSFFYARTLLIPTYFDPLYVIPEEYSNSTQFIFINIKTYFNQTVSEMLKFVHLNAFTPKKIIVIISNRTEYWLVNRDCVFVFLTHSPFIYAKHNCKYNSQINVYNFTTFIEHHFLVNSSIKSYNVYTFLETGKNGYIYYVKVYILDLAQYS